jgi:outer membrane protein assembly factor BamB
MPLLAQSESAVLYVAPGNGGGTDGTVIVTDERPEIAAFDALTGAQLWSVAPPNPAPLVASPTLSVDGTTVYVANTGGEMYAYDVATGTLNSAFGTNGVVTVSAGKGTVSAPVVDAAGRIYVVGNDGTLYCFDASGNQLWTIAGGVGPGETGMIAPKAMTAAIDANGTLYVTGTSGNVRGFADVGPPPDTATPTQTGTVTPTPTITPTPSITLTPSITPTPSATGTPTATSDVTNTPVESGPAPGWSMLGGSASHTGFAPVSIDLSHAPGTLWATNLVPLLGGTKPVRQSAVSGPDGTVYQPDGNGALVALDPASGAIKWRSADVLGQVQPPTSFPVLDTGSSAAVAANGTIYAGSENGGIYSFSPTDGSDHEISTDGTYQNSSIVIGPDGTLYGASVDGTVYALSPTGQAYWAAGDGYQITNCPPASTLSIISTPALDQNGNLYIGYTCKTSTAAYKGGVISLNPDGTLRWHQNNTNSGGSPVPFGAVFGPAVLSPDGSTLYVVDTGGAGGKQLVALNTSNGQVKWSFAAGGDIETPPVLSADGQHLYLTVSAVQQGPSGGRPYEDSPLIEFNPDGSVANALHLAQDPLLDDSYTTVRPVVDADGNLLLVTAHNLLGYSGDLSHQLFPPFFLGVTQASTFLGGLSVDSTGHIYVSDNSGNLLALSSAIIQPTATPVNTAFPPPTQITRPTSTPFVFFPTAKPVVTEPPSARETAIASILAPNCQLYLLPNPHIVQQGGAETIRVKGLPNDAVTVEVAGAASDSWLGAAREYANGTDSTVAFTFNGVANRSYWSTSITIPAGGNVLLVWQVPATAVSAFYGVYAITTSSTCHQYSNLSVPGRHLEEAGSLYNFGFNVWPPSYTTFDTKIQQGLKDGLIRSVEPAYTPDIVPSVVYAQPDTAPTLANTNSAVYDHVHVLTAPGSMVELQEWVVAKPITTGVPTQTQNQISGYPAPVALPAKFFDATTTANQTHTNSNGSVNTYANFLVPVWSNLVIPGRGITIERVVYINGHLIITGDYQVRETRLRLVIQANESTRGDQRAVITLNRPHAGNSHTTVTVTVLADKGATLTARLVLHGTTYFPINATPIVTGNGGRVHLKFTVVDGSAPTPPHAVQTAQLMVTSTFRGATISRTATIFYQQK